MTNFVALVAARVPAVDEPALLDRLLAREAQQYRTSNQRRRQLSPWLRYYNYERPHSALAGRSPIQRIRRNR